MTLTKLLSLKCTIRESTDNHKLTFKYWENKSALLSPRPINFSAVGDFKNSSTMLSYEKILFGRWLNFAQ